MTNRAYVKITADDLLYYSSVPEMSILKNLKGLSTRYDLSHTILTLAYVIELTRVQNVRFQISPSANE